MGVGSSQAEGEHPPATKLSLGSLPHFRKELRSGVAEGKDNTEKMHSLLQRQGKKWAREKH